MVAKKHSVKKAENASRVNVETNNDTATHGPLVVKIISILGYIGSAFSILFGFLLLFGGSFIASMMPMMDISSIPAAIIGAVFTVMAILMILFGIAFIFVSKALWDYKNWARIVMIVCSVLGLLGGLTNLPESIIGILINGAIVYFLAFDKNVLKLFK